MKNIKIDDYNYDLPDERIAKYPLEKRDESKLLVWEKGKIKDEAFKEIALNLPENSLLVFNNTKVIRARLFFRKETGALIEIFVLEPENPADYAQNFQQTERCSWHCIVGNLKKWKQGILRLKLEINGESIELHAENKAASGSGRVVEFSWNKPYFNFSQILDAAGKIPIPPYLHRESEDMDLERYQTVFSKIKGSVAAPTAGLHFTDRVFDELKKREMHTAELTLHVGAGTFQPVKSESIDGHEMHTEHFLIRHDFLLKLIQHEGAVIPVGTTSIRTLESLYWMGIKVLAKPNCTLADLSVKQWEPYHQEENTDTKVAMEALLQFMEKNKLEVLSTSTQIIIVPGYKFRVIEGMITNFHQPKSTLLLLISVWLGENWKRIYDHALNNDYRFLSYGDSNLYLR